MTTKKAARGVTRAAVLAILLREADMDGLVTVAEREIGAELGIGERAVSLHIQTLASDGLLTIIPFGSGFKSMNAIQLAESVYAA